MPIKHTVRELVLKNGARGLLIDVPGTTVASFSFCFRAGNDYVDKPERQQTAHVMEHMAFGTNKVFDNPEAFSQEITKNGARYNAITWDRDMGYYVDSALMEWERILDVLKMTIVEPTYKEKILDAEKGNVREELTGDLNNYGRMINQRVYRALGEELALDSKKLETVDAITTGDIRRHHKATHTTENLRFIIAGDLGGNRDKIIAKLEAWKLPRGKRLPVKMSHYHEAPPVTIVRKDMSSVRFLLTLALNRELTSSEQDTMGALNHILNGTFHSRIWGKARSLGLCYGMGSHTSSDVSGVSSWDFYGQISLANSSALFDLIATQLSKIAKGDLKDTELEVAKQYALGGFEMRGQTVASLANWYGDEYFEKDFIDDINNSPKYIKHTKLSQIEALAKEFIESGIWTLGLIGNVTKDDTKLLYNKLQLALSSRGTEL